MSPPPYKVHVGAGLLDNATLFRQLVLGTERTVIITDSLVCDLYAKKIQAHLHDTQPLLLTFKAGEEQKNRQTKAELEDAMFEAGCNKDTCVFAVGGGVVSDLAGFVASTYCRGVPMVYAPTTLLSMVDAGVGGKTAVNTPYGKNLIGTFHQPRQVLMDTHNLTTLPNEALNDGFAEMLKHALIDDATLLDGFIKQHAKFQKHDKHWLLAEDNWLVDSLTQSVATKKKHVEADEFDNGKRHALNFGHTIGHAIEQNSLYALRHGHAVAIGMLVESYIALLEGCLNPQDFAMVENILQLCGFALDTPWLENVEQTLRCMSMDKKSTAVGIRVVILDGLGKTVDSTTRIISEVRIREALHWYNTIYRKKGARAC